MDCCTHSNAQSATLALQCAGDGPATQARLCRYASAPPSHKHPNIGMYAFWYILRAQDMDYCTQYNAKAAILTAAVPVPAQQNRVAPQRNAAVSQGRIATHFLSHRLSPTQKQIQAH